LIELTDEQMRQREAFRSFVDARVAPFADGYDREERMPRSLIEETAKQGYLGAPLPKEYGGGGMSMLVYGLLNEEIARGCSSLRSLLTVHGMAAHVILKWGSKELRERWLPLLATGEKIAAFALTEPDVGSDARAIETSAVAQSNSYVLNGRKRWITFGQIADVFLVFAQCEGRPTAILVERDTAGLSIEPISGMLGVRASMLAELQFENCRVPRENIVGREGFGFSHVASMALDLGRYTVAWGCVGIGQACLEASLNYASERQQFGKYLRDHQLIRRLLTGMITNVKAARLLCLHAGRLKDSGAAEAMMETSVAKYFAATMATKVASDAVQIHGAHGCSSESPVQRHLRDAKIMEIIEGSTQMQEILIAEHGYQGGIQ
jgi:alkylation response protein AidB-like acyl-CoA dehydrogenase